MTIGADFATLQEKLELKNYTDAINLETKMVYIPDVNRPGLQLNGFYEHFDANRIQILGNVEHAYMEHFDEEKRHKQYDKLLSYPIPAVIFCRGIEPEEYFIKTAEKNGIPVLGTDRNTSEFEAELISKLSLELAPSTGLHGVLVDVYGEGLLITGESGIGKSEAALELIRRGHRLVADDTVEIKKTSQNTLLGYAPKTTKHFIELRGIGIIDVKSLYGVECVKDIQRIDLVIKLEDWNKGAEYDRLGLQEEHMEILDVPIVCHSLPIRPGRNLAVICETAAVNHRQKKMGYNAAEELYRRVQENIKNHVGE